MKIPLVGQGYPSRSLAVSAQECTNVFPALIQDPGDGAVGTVAGIGRVGPEPKNKATLFGAPGKHIRATLATDVRGLWTGAGRLFVISGTNEIEVNQGGGVISTHAIPSGIDDGFPAQIFSNGGQLLVIAGGFAYCDNGAGPVLITVADSGGVVNVFGTGVTWVSGQQFTDDGSWVGKTITLNGTPYVIDGGGFVPPPTMTQLYVTIAPGILPGATYVVLGEPLTAVTGAVLNGTFFVQRPPTTGRPAYGAQVNFSAPLQGLSGDPLNNPTWNGLDYFRKEGAPDNIVGILSDNHQLYVMGEETGEVFQADPNATVDSPPFVTLSGAMFNFGLISPWACVAFAGKVLFVGGDETGGPMAFVLNGFTPVRISTDAEESHWRAQGLGRNCVAYSYTEEGQSFFCINFGAETWCYELVTGAWHSRMKWTGSAFAPYLTNLHTFIPEWGADGEHITACTTGPAKLYVASLNTYDDEGTDIKWRRALPYLYNGGKLLFIGRIDLEMETGAVPSGAAPIITLDYSDDRGKTFLNPRDANEGVAADTAHRVFWNRNGKSYGRILRLSGIGQSKVVLIDLEADITMGVV